MFDLIVGLVIIFCFIMVVYACFSMLGGIIKEINDFLWERKEAKKARPEMDRLGFKDFTKYRSYLWSKKFEEDRRAGKYNDCNWG